MNLLCALRDDTHDIHTALHTHPLLEPLADESITLESYKRAIILFSQFYYEYESALATPMPATLPNAPTLEWLAMDCEFLQLPTPAHSSFIDVRPIESEAELLGYLYVKQGSTLGGQVISHNLEKSLGLEPHKHQHFFAGYGKKETAARWSEFKAYLSEYEQRCTHKESDILRKTAYAAFYSLQQACGTILTETTNEVRSA